MKNLRNNFLFLVLRKLGDSFIHLNFINNLAKHNKVSIFYVWINKDCKNVLINPEDNIVFIENDFDIHKIKFFQFSNIKNLIENIFYIRSLDIKYVINFYYSTKELFFLKLLKKSSILIKYSKNNNFIKYLYNNQFINWFLLKKNYVGYKTNKENIYSILEEFDTFLINKLHLKSNFLNNFANSQNKINICKTNKVNIGISIFSDVPSKNYPLERLSSFIERYKKYNIYFFIEQTSYLSFFNYKYLDDVNFICTDIKSSIKKVNEMDIFIATDSFFSHVAGINKNILSIILYGPTLPQNFLPPNSNYLSDMSNCTHYPCYYKHYCKNQENEFSCMRHINLEIMYAKIDDFIHNKHK